MLFCSTNIWTMRPMAVPIVEQWNSGSDTVVLITDPNWEITHNPSEQRKVGKRERVWLRKGSHAICTVTTVRYSALQCHYSPMHCSADSADTIVTNPYNRHDSTDKSTVRLAIPVVIKSLDRFLFCGGICCVDMSWMTVHLFRLRQAHSQKS